MHRAPLGPIVAGLMIAASLLLGACVKPHRGAAADGPLDRAATARSDRPAPAEAGSSTPEGTSTPERSGKTRETCPVTRPPKQPFVPPKPYPPRPPPEYGSYWHGTSRLWTWLRPDGTWPMMDAGDTYAAKTLWWRERYDWTREQQPKLGLTAKRVDDPKQVAAVSDALATNGFHEDIGAFMLTAMELPSLGCWEITGHYAGTRLSFVVWVTAPA